MESVSSRLTKRWRTIETHDIDLQPPCTCVHTCTHKHTCTLKEMSVESFLERAKSEFLSSESDTASRSSSLTAIHPGNLPTRHCSYSMDQTSRSALPTVPSPSQSFTIRSQPCVLHIFIQPYLSLSIQMEKRASL